MHEQKVVHLIFFLWFISSHPSFSLQQANKKSQPDSLIEIASNLSVSNPDSGLLVIEKAIGSAELKKNSLGKAYTIKGQLFNELAQYDSAIVYLSNAISLLEQHALDTPSLEQAYHNYGVSCFYQERIEESLKWYLKSLKLAELRYDSVALSSSYGNVAMVLRRLGENERAKTYYKTALTIARLKNINNQELRLLVK